MNTTSPTNPALAPEADVPQEGRRRVSQTNGCQQQAKVL